MPQGISLAAWQWTIVSIYGVVLIGTIGRHILCHAVIRRTTFLTPLSKAWTAAKAPKVSIIVPAKDEAANIEVCLDSLLAQDYPNYEVILVDDRSEDGTAEIGEAIGLRDARLRVLRVQRLPEGWTGKTHALHFAQERVEGEWLLFVDADAWLHPACLSVVLRDAHDRDAGLASVLPRMDMRSFWEKVVQPLAATLLMTLFPLPRVNDRNRTDGGFANGQFMLMRRTAYDAIGGHESVKDKFCEDINLGRLIKQQGLGLRVVLAPALVRVRMYASLRQIMRGWSRIFYAATDANPVLLTGFVVALFLLSVLPYIILPVCGIIALAGAAGTFTALIATMAFAQEFLQTTVFARAYLAGHTPLRLLAWRWLSTLTMIAVLVQTIRLCKTHKIVWRGTHYASMRQGETTLPARRAA
ncbi:MAG: glycosyltransferase [Planctomycetaceae bacterium]|nr:glycosyltransferase [Planctomycetaceae bacterium]